MKKPILTLFFALAICITSFGQQKVKSKDLIGNWKLVIELDEAFNEAKEDLDEDNEWLAKLFLNSVSGFVGGILDRVDIYMEFKPGGELMITVNAFGEKEVEKAKWSIDNKGRLHIEDSDTIDNDDDYWIMNDGVLVNSDVDEDQYVYMVKIDK